MLVRRAEGGDGIELATTDRTKHQPAGERTSKSSRPLPWASNCLNSIESVDPRVVDLIVAEVRRAFRNCWVLSIPRGYVNWRGEFESMDFNPGLVVDINSSMGVGRLWAEARLLSGLSLEFVG